MVELTVASYYTRRTIPFGHTIYVVKRRLHFNDRETVLFVVKMRWYHRLWFWLLRRKPEWPTRKRTPGSG